MLDRSIPLVDLHTAGHGHVVAERAEAGTVDPRERGDGEGRVRARDERRAAAVRSRVVRGEQVERALDLCGNQICNPTSTYATVYRT